MKLRRALPTCAFILAVAACEPPTAAREEPAYDPTELTGGRLYRWPLGSSIAIYVDPTNAPPNDALPRAVERAAVLWNMTVHYQEFELRLTSSPSEADVIVRERTAPLLVDTRDCEYPQPFGLAFTFFCPSTEGAIPDSALVLPLLSGEPGRVKADVWVNWAGAGTEQRFAALVAHELGHVLGLGAHSADPADLMHSSVAVSAPSERDARTLRWLLHQPADIRF